MLKILNTSFKIKCIYPLSKCTLYIFLKHVGTENIFRYDNNYLQLLYNIKNTVNYTQYLFS